MNFIAKIFNKRANWAIPYAIFLAMFVALPLVLIVVYAFQNAEGAFSLENFVKFVEQPEAVNTFIYSIGIALITTILCILLGYPAAWILSNQKLNRSEVTVVLFILPMWINILVRTLATVALFDFLKFPLGEGALIFGMVYNFLPFMVLPIYNVLIKIDKDVINAARDLGANAVQVFTKVILPLSVPGIISGITMVFVPALTTFVISDILGGSKILLIGNVIEQEFTQSYNWHVGSGLSLVLMIFVMVSMTIMNIFDKDGEGTAVW